MAAVKSLLVITALTVIGAYFQIPFCQTIAITSAVLLLTTWWLNQDISVTKHKTLPEKAIFPLDFGHKLMNETGSRGIMMLGNVLVLESPHQITVDQIREAAYHLMMRHPLLRACIQTPDGFPTMFMEMPNVSRESVPLKQVDTEDWKTVLEDMLLETYDSHKGPLWRLLFLPRVHYSKEVNGNFPQESAVIFGFNHVIVDGTSYTRLFAEFLEILDRVMGNLPVPEKHNQVYGSITNYVEPPSRFWALLGQVLVPLMNTRPVKALRDTSYFLNPYIKKYGAECHRNPNVEKKTCIIPVEFSPEETSRLLRACKHNGCTVQGAVQAAGGVSAAHFLSNETGDVVGRKSDVMVDVPIGCTVNLRPFLKGTPVPADALGNYLSIMISKSKFNTAVDKTTFWELAKHETDGIKKKIKDGSHLLIAKAAFMPDSMLPSIVSVMTSQSEARAGRGDICVTFTNLGNCPFLVSDSDRVRLRARFGCSSEHDCGGIFTNNIITFGGKMFWTFVYYSNIITRERELEFIKLVRENLTMATNE